MRFDGQTRGARFLNRVQGIRRFLRWHYGDNTIFVRNVVYWQIGAFRPYPLFEDADLVTRIRRAGRFVTLPGPVISSSRRFDNGRFLSTSLLWILLQGLYWVGVHRESWGVCTPQSAGPSLRPRRPDARSMEVRMILPGVVR